MTDDWDEAREQMQEIRAFADPANPDSTDPVTRGRLLGFSQYGPIYSGLGGIVLDPADLMLEDLVDGGRFRTFPWGTGAVTLPPGVSLVHTQREYVQKFRAIVKQFRAAHPTDTEDRL